MNYIRKSKLRPSQYAYFITETQNIYLIKFGIGILYGLLPSKLYFVFSDWHCLMPIIL